MKHINLLSCIIAISMAISCSDKNEIENTPLVPQTFDVQGKVEKGPYVSGSEITIQPVDAKLQALGSMFNTSITDDLGCFTLGSKEFPAQYAEFIANGYFYNEVKGTLSNGTLTLRALVDLKNKSTINVNVLTHLKYSRIRNLVASGLSFADADNKAQKELMSAFGLSSYGTKEVSSYSVITGSEESAILIAVSSLLLMERSEASFTEYLAKLSSEFGKTGIFSAEMQAMMSDDKKKLANLLPDIKDNLIKRYESLGFEINVKELAYYIDWDSDGIAGNEILKEGENVSIEKTTVEIPNEGGSFSIKVDSPISLYFEPQVIHNLDSTPGNSVIEEFFSSGLYEGYDDSYLIGQEIECKCRLEENILYVDVMELQSLADKKKQVVLYDYIGNEICSIELTQKGKSINGSEVGIPLLGEYAKLTVAGMAKQLAEAFRDYNVIEQYYNLNKTNNVVNSYVNPGSEKIINVWTKLYKTGSMLLQLQQADEERLNIYTDYINVIRALYYSNLVYGWGSVPYITHYGAQEQYVNNGGLPQESAETIFKDLENKLTLAIANLQEKKNDSLSQDVNGFFFASKDVARVLLANIYMYMGNYAEAKPLLQYVIDNGYYELDSSKDYVSVSAKQSVDISLNSEIILALYVQSETSISDNSILIPNMIPYITLSEVYLSMAECCYMLGDPSSADRFVDMVIDRKGLTYYEENVLMKIKSVREQILLHSGTYFAFLKRTGIAKDVCGIENYQLLFPIPSQEMEFNRYIIQNPGY